MDFHGFPCELMLGTFWAPMDPQPHVESIRIHACPMLCPLEFHNGSIYGLYAQVLGTCEQHMEPHWAHVQVCDWAYRKMRLLAVCFKFDGKLKRIGVLSSHHVCFISVIDLLYICMFTEGGWECCVRNVYLTSSHMPGGESDDLYRLHQLCKFVSLMFVISLKG